jgi:ribonuclease BN (tRNA processing enzyme)
MVDVCLPGTGGMIPLRNRWLTCCLIEYQGTVILIDCGEGTQIALKEAGCKLSRLDILLVTHFHADHIAGLPGLLLSLGNNGKTTPLTITGPAGLRKVVSALTVIAPVLPFPLIFDELKNKAKSTALASVRDEEVWSQLIPSQDTTKELFKVISFHFPENLDNSGFVGWLASHLKQKLGTGVFVTCGQNSNRGGIFDYWGCPYSIEKNFVEEIASLIEKGKQN